VSYIVSILTVTICNIFRLHVADGQRIIWARFISTQSGGHCRFQTVSTIDQEHMRASRFLLTPVEVIANDLTGLAYDCHSVSYTCRHGGWRPSHLDDTSDIWYWKYKNKYPHNY
jgi:hypothetical protein